MITILVLLHFSLIGIFKIELLLISKICLCIYHSANRSVMVCIIFTDINLIYMRFTLTHNSELWGMRRISSSERFSLKALQEVSEIEKTEYIHPCIKSLNCL